MAYLDIERTIGDHVVEVCGSENLGMHGGPAVMIKVSSKMHDTRGPVDSVVVTLSLDDARQLITDLFDVSLAAMRRRDEASR